MKNYVIINSKKKPSSIDVPDAEIFQTEHPGQAPELIQKICKEISQKNLHIYGGDGSVFETVNAVMQSNAQSNTTVVIHPFGTGNDFARNYPDVESPTPNQIDLIRFDSMYAANEINIGFDCDVVVTTKKIKKIIKGSAAYLISALLTLFKPIGRTIDITVVDEDGEEETINEKMLLCLFANGQYYGGGFQCAPLASLSDGLLEFIYVKNISRIKFLRFFMGYRNGKHFLKDGSINPKYRDFFRYKKIRSATVRQVGSLCADGEIFTFDTLHISIQEKAINVQVEKKAK